VEQEIHIILRFTLATGKVNLNEIVYRLKELRDPLMLGKDEGSGLNNQQYNLYL
jgi:hypothetical protein